MANTGPGWNSNSRVLGFHTERPVTSVGCRSGVHWIRETVAPAIEPANERARTVLAVPGTSSRSTCPLHANAASTSLTCSSLPSTMVPTFWAMRAAMAPARSIRSSAARGAVVMPE